MLNARRILVTLFARQTRRTPTFARCSEALRPPEQDHETGGRIGHWAGAVIPRLGLFPRTLNAAGQSRVHARSIPGHAITAVRAFKSSSWAMAGGADGPTRASRPGARSCPSGSRRRPRRRGLRRVGGTKVRYRFLNLLWGLFGDRQRARPWAGLERGTTKYERGGNGRV